MANQRYIKLSNIGISKERYDELSAFARQYQEWKHKVKFSDSEKLNKKIELLEGVARDSSVKVIGEPGMAQYLIINVSEQRPCFYLRNILGMPYPTKQFYKARTEFFSILNEVKE